MPQQTQGEHKVGCALEICDPSAHFKTSSELAKKKIFNLCCASNCQVPSSALFSAAHEHCSRTSMKAIVYKTFGAPDVLKLVNHPLPQRSAGELLVKVKSTSVNPVDYKTRNGSIPIAKKNKVMPTQIQLRFFLCGALELQRARFHNLHAHACRSLAVILRESSNQLMLIPR